MMQAFRSSAKVIAVVFAVLMLLFLVELSGITGGSSGVFTRTSVGKVNGRSIEATAYQNAVQQTIEARQQERTGRLGLDDLTSIRDEVWEQFVTSTVLTSEYARRGLTVTAREVAEMVQQVPPAEVQSLPQFQTDGRFDLEKYQRWLSSSVGLQYVPILEAQYRQEILRSKLLRVVTADVYLSDAALWQRYRDNNETVKIALTAFVPRNAIPDSAVTVAPGEVDRYYREHGEEFSRPATAFLSYVAVPRLPDASDTTAALDRATEIRQEIVEGAAFDEVARRESADTVSGNRGGDLGEWTRGSFVPAFDAVAFTQPLQAISQPVLTEFGYHLIQVSRRSGDKATGRHILIPIEIQGEHRDRLDARADSLEALGADRLDPAALDTAARALQLPIARTGPVQRGSKVQLGLEVIPDAGTWAFQAKVGEVSPVIETPIAYYLFRVDSLFPEGVPPLAKIREAVETAVRSEKKIGATEALAQRYLKRLEEGSTMAQAATALGLPHREFGPFTRINPPFPNPTMTGAAFGLKQGERSGVLKTPDGLYIIEVLERTTADSAAFLAGLDEYRAQQVRQAQQDRVRYYLAALRSSAKVVDRRAEIFRTSAQIDAEADAAPRPPVGF